MTSKRDDCESVLGGGPWAASTCEGFEKRSAAQRSAQERALRALDESEGIPATTTYDSHALVTKTTREERAAAADLRELDLVENAMLDGLAGDVGRELLAQGHTAKRAHDFSRMTRDIGTTLRFELNRIRGERLPKVLNALVRAQARREPRAPAPVFRAAGIAPGWRHGVDGSFSKFGYARRAVVRQQAMGDRWLLVLTDWNLTGKPTRMRLLDNLPMLFPSSDAARATGDAWLATALDEGQGGEGVLTEDEYRVMTARGPVADIINRADIESRFVMGKLADTFRAQQRAIDRASGRLVPADADSAGRMRRQAVVVRAGPTGIHGREAEGVDASTGKRAIVFSVTDLVRKSVGLPPRAEPRMVERGVQQAVAIQAAYNDPGLEELRPLQGRGIFDKALDCWWRTPEAMAAAHSTLDGAPGARPFRSPEAMAHTRSGSTIGLHGQVATAQIQADQRGMRGNAR